MAQQEGLIKLKGRIGDLTFYKTRNGFQARAKKGVDSKRIANDPSFQRTRENGAEFGRACTAGKLLRNVFKPLTVNLSDHAVSNRMMKEMLKVIQADAVNERGLRQVLDAETEMLTGFEFNLNGLVASTISVPYSATIDRVLGEAKVSFSEFSAADMISKPSGATHFKLKVAVASIDFENDFYEVDIQETATLSLSNKSIDPIELKGMIRAASTHPIFLLLGINFCQQVNRIDYPLSNGAYNGLRIVQILGV